MSATTDNPGLDLDARHGGDQARDARVHRRCPGAGDGRAPLRSPGLHPGRRGVPEQPPGASLIAIRRGFLSVGVEDNQVLIFPELMDATSLFLTPNSDTVYFWTFVDLTNGPMVFDVPAMPAPSAILGTIDDMWFRWVTDVGLPGPDRGEGGKYLLVGPGYDGPLARQRLPRVPCRHDPRDPDRPGVHDRQ